ncbi:MAG: hypothetical protein ABJG15_07255 [Hyphomonadaceae bacterium]
MPYTITKTSVIASTILLSTLSAAPALGESVTIDDQQEQHILGEVTTEGQRFTPDAPQTGLLLVRPVLTHLNRKNEQRQRRNFTMSHVTEFELVFTAVELAENGEIQALPKNQEYGFASRVRPARLGSPGAVEMPLPSRITPLDPSLCLAAHTP